MKLNEIGAYWDTRAEGYSISIHNQLESDVWKYYMDLIRSARPEGDCLNCLDIGCGPGFFSILLNRDGHHVTSFDYSGEMLEQTKANLQEFGFEPHIQQGDAQNLPFEDNTFDLIVSRDLVWNLEYPDRAYAEWMRVLKPGGRIFVADGNHYLYYYDEDYRAARETRTAGTHSCHGVDPTPINEIARDLPLSKQHRPEWDIKMMGSLGMNNMVVRPNTHTFQEPKTGENKTIITHFILWGQK